MYSVNDNNVVGLIHPTKENIDIPYADIPNYDGVDTMGYDIIDAVEHGNVHICDEYDSIFA